MLKGITHSELLLSDTNVKLVNRVIIQWGQTSVRNSDSQQTITLPIAFSSTNYGIGISNLTSNTNTKKVDPFKTKQKQDYSLCMGE